LPSPINCSLLAPSLPEGGGEGEKGGVTSRLRRAIWGGEGGGEGKKKGEMPPTEKRGGGGEGDRIGKGPFISFHRERKAPWVAVQEKKRKGEKVTFSTALKKLQPAFFLCFRGKGRTRTRAAEVRQTFIGQKTSITLKGEVRSKRRGKAIPPEAPKSLYFQRRSCKKARKGSTSNRNIGSAKPTLTLAEEGRRMPKIASYRGRRFS